MGALNNAGLFLTNVIFSLYIFVIMLRILLEFVGADYHNPLSQFVLKLTDEPIKLLQKVIPRVRVIDLPAVVFVLIVELLKLLLFSLLAANFPVIDGLLLWAVADLLKELINLYFYMIILFVILSWLAHARFGPLALILFKLVDPWLRQARRLIPPIAGIDLSPLIAIIVLQLVNIILILPLISFAMRLAFR